MNEQIKWLPEMKYITGEDAVKIVEMATKDSKYCINLIDKAGAQCEKINSNFERSSVLDKMLSINTTSSREIICESQLMWQTLLLSYFMNLSHPAWPSASTILTSQQPSTLRQDPPPAKDYDSLNAQMIV